MADFRTAKARAGRSPAAWTGEFSRRQVLRGAGAAAAMVATGAAHRSLGGQAQAAGTLNYMCWEGYNDPRIVEPFEAKEGVKLNFDLIVDSPAGFAKIAAGGHREFDVVSSDVPWIVRMGPASLCEYLDPADYQDVYAKYYPQFQHPFDPLMHDGKITGLPTRWGWVGPIVNTETSKIEQWTSYDPCFDSRNKDKIGIMDWGDWPIMPMALHAGINPYEPLGKAELDEIRKVLRALFKNSRALFSDLSLSQKALLDGSVITLVGSGTYSTSGLRKAGYSNIVSLVPESVGGFKKGIIWLEATGVIKEPNNPEAANKLVRHIASAESAYALSLTDFTCNPTPNREVEKLYTDEERSILQLDYVDDVWNKSVLHTVAPNIDDMLAIWQEELAAAN